MRDDDLDPHPSGWDFAVAMVLIMASAGISLYGLMWLVETVDSSGKTKAQESYDWSGKQSRLTYLVEKHLQYSIETAMKDALKTANSAIATGIEATVKIKLREISDALKFSVIVK